MRVNPPPIAISKWMSRQSVKPWSYFICGGPFVKIGSARSPQQRLQVLQTGCPYELSIYAVSHRKEGWLHDKFSHLWVRGEWFSWECGTIKSWIDQQWADHYGDRTLLDEHDIEKTGLSKPVLLKLIKPYSDGNVSVGSFKLMLDDRTNVCCGVRVFESPKEDFDPEIQARKSELLDKLLGL